MQANDKIPGPGFWENIASLNRLRKKPHLEVAHLFQSYGDTVNYSAGPFNMYFLFHPEAVKTVLQDTRSFSKKSYAYSVVKTLVGDGLLMAEGDRWREKRKAIQPAFHHKYLESLLEVVIHRTESMLDAWETQAPLDIHGEMTGLTLQIVVEALLGQEIKEEMAVIGKVLDLGQLYCNRRTSGLVHIPFWAPTPFNINYKKNLEVMNGIVRKIIHKRLLKQGEERPDLLSGFIQALKQEGKVVGPEEVEDLKDEVKTFIFAGHETTAAALSWALYLFCRHPELKRRCEEEIFQVLGTRRLDLQSLKKLGSLERFFKETLRLYPSAWWIERFNEGDSTIGDFKLKKKSALVLSPWVTHRHPAFWKEPEKFDPERFRPDAEEARHPCAYFPFGAGPRICIGNIFASLEGMAILCMILQRYKISLDSDQMPGIEAKITMKPSGMPRLIIESRV